MDQASLLLRKQLKGRPELEASRLTGNVVTAFQVFDSADAFIKVPLLRELTLLS